MKEQSQRQLRVAQQVRHELSNVFHHGGFNNPLLMNSEEITVTEVSMSPDLKNAKAYVLHLGDSKIDKDLLKALNEVAPALQGKIARNLGLKSTPKLRFEEDKTFLEAQRLTAVLAGIKTSDAE